METIKRTRGRPSKPKDEKFCFFTVSMPQQMKESLDELARTEHRSRSAQVVALLERVLNAN